MTDDIERTVTVDLSFNTFGKPGQIDKTVDHIRRVLELAGLDVVSMSYSYVAATLTVGLTGVGDSQ